MNATRICFEAHVPVMSEGLTAVDVLFDQTDLSKARIKMAMQKGAVWLSRGKRTQRLRRAKRELRSGDELHLYFDEAVLSEEPAAPTLVADLDAYSVWDKPYGLRSQGSRWGDHCTVVRWAEQNLKPERPAFTVHRLDRAASGLILVAHTKQMAAALSALFRERRVEKRYSAWVTGSFPPTSEPLRVTTPIDGKPAASEFSLLKVEGNQSLLDVRIETGRKHQVRRHLADLGYPIAGDRLYGCAAGNEVDLRLRAYFLSFQSPLGDSVVEYRTETF